MSKELNVYGSFTPGPWKTPAEIVAAVATTSDRKWSPATAELKAFAESGKGRAEGVGDSFALLAAIIRNKPDRINIFTHANKRFIYFSGKVVPGNVEWDDSKPYNSLDVDYLAHQEEDGTTFSGGTTKDASFDDFRKALPSTAILCLYACDAALGRELCIGIATYFNIKVKAFKDEIRYYPSVVKGSLAMKYAVGNHDLVTDFHDLEKYFEAPFVPKAKP
jgi:hypothetical protein